MGRWGGEGGGEEGEMGRRGNGEEGEMGGGGDGRRGRWGGRQLYYHIEPRMKADVHPRIRSIPLGAHLHSQLGQL